MSVYKAMPVERMIWSTPSTSDTISTYVVSLPRTSVFAFCNKRERATENPLSNQLVFSRRLSMSLSNGQENPSLENFILAVILRYATDLNRFFSGN